MGMGMRSSPLLAINCKTSLFETQVSKRELNQTSKVGISLTVFNYA